MGTRTLLVVQIIVCPCVWCGDRMHISVVAAEGRQQDARTIRLKRRSYVAVAMMADLAQPGEKPAPLHSVAAKLALSVSYMEMLAADLRRGHLIKSSRGPGGGYRLLRPAATISIADIALAANDGRGARNSESDDSFLANPQVEDLRNQIEACEFLLLQHISLADVVNGIVDVNSSVKRLADAVL